MPRAVPAACPQDILTPRPPAPWGQHPARAWSHQRCLGGGSAHRTFPLSAQQGPLRAAELPASRGGTRRGHTARCSQLASSLPSLQSASPSHRQALGTHSWSREQPHCWSRHSPSSWGQSCRSRGGGERCHQPPGNWGRGSPARSHLLIRAVLAVSGPVAAPGLGHALPAAGTRHLARAAQQGPRHRAALLVRAIPAVPVPVTAQGQGHALPAAAGELGWAALLGRCRGGRGGWMRKREPKAQPQTTPCHHPPGVSPQRCSSARSRQSAWPSHSQLSGTQRVAASQRRAQSGVGLQQPASSEASGHCGTPSHRSPAPTHVAPLTQWKAPGETRRCAGKGASTPGDLKCSPNYTDGVT